MARLSTLTAVLGHYLRSLRQLLEDRPAVAEVADTADTLEGVSAAQLIQEAQSATNDHLTHSNNPHNVTLDQVGGISRGEVEQLVQDKVPLNVLSVSQYGDTSGDDLGIRYTGYRLQFTKPVSSYLLATYRMMPAQEIDLTSIETDPASKVFYVHLRLKAQSMDYEVSTAPLPETADTMYLGSVRCGPSAIVGHSIDRVTRIGTRRLAMMGVGNGIPVTQGPSSAPAKIDGGWFPAPPELAVTAGLVHRWPLMRSVNDLLGQAHGQMVMGTPDYVTISGRSGFRFLEGQQIAIPSFTVLGNDPWTFSVWYYPESFADYTHLLTSRSNQNNFCLKLAAQAAPQGEGVPYVHSSLTVPDQISSPQGIPILRWSMITFTHDGQNTCVYIDGELKVTTAKTYAVPQTTWCIGRYGDEISRGVQSDLLYFNRALDPSEVQALYSGA